MLCSLGQCLPSVWCLLVLDGVTHSAKRSQHCSATAQATGSLPTWFNFLLSEIAHQGRLRLQTEPDYSRFEIAI